MSKDIAASVRARLLNLAKAEHSDFNQVLVRFALERMLYRLSKSAYSNQFLLKGALLFTLWYDMPHRQTRDADLLGLGPADLASIKQSFRDIAAIKVDDGTYPVLLNDLPAPKLRTYSVYTVIAEKLHAIAILGMTNTRLKDYLDLFVLFERETLQRDLLGSAIAATFERRGSDVFSPQMTGLSDEFANDLSKQKMWLALLKKNGIPTIPLATAVAAIRRGISF
jgi:predicted nucleotidyltransferase component of viral defense system